MKKICKYLIITILIVLSFNTRVKANDYECPGDKCALLCSYNYLGSDSKKKTYNIYYSYYKNMVVGEKTIIINGESKLSPFEMGELSEAFFDYDDIREIPYFINNKLLKSISSEALKKIFLENQCPSILEFDDDDWVSCIKDNEGDDSLCNGNDKKIEFKEISDNNTNNSNSNVVINYMKSNPAPFKSEDKNLELVCLYREKGIYGKESYIYYNILEDNFYYSEGPNSLIPLENMYKFKSRQAIYTMRGFNYMYKDEIDNISNFTCPQMYHYSYDDDIPWTKIEYEKTMNNIDNTEYSPVFKGMMKHYAAQGYYTDKILELLPIPIDTIPQSKSLKEQQEAHVEGLKNTFGVEESDDFFGYLTNDMIKKIDQKVEVDDKEYDLLRIGSSFNFSRVKEFNRLEDVLKNKKDEYNLDCDKFKDKIIATYEDINEEDIYDICIFKRPFPKKNGNEFRNSVVVVNVGSENRFFEYWTEPDPQLNTIKTSFKEVPKEMFGDSIKVYNGIVCSQAGLYTDDNEYIIAEDLDDIGYFNISSKNYKDVQPGMNVVKLTCEEILGSDFVKEINSYLLYIKVAVPIIIVVMGSIDFGSAFISSDEEKMKKAQKRFIQRLIIGIVIFFIPAFVKILLNISSEIWSIGNDTCNIKF